MFDAWDLKADVEARRRTAGAAFGAALAMAAMGMGVALIASHPVSLQDESKHKVDVSFRPPPPPPEPAVIEKPPPPPKPKVKTPPPPQPVVVAEVVAPPAPAPAAAPMVAPKQVPTTKAPESDTVVEARTIAVGGTGDGSGSGSGGPPGPDDDSPAPVVASLGHGPVNLPEDADPPEPNEDNVQPEYPESARTTGQEARVVLKIVVERDGRVGRVQVLKGEEPFVSAALSAVKGWRYEPAQLDGQPIAVFKIVNLTFQLRE